MDIVIIGAGLGGLAAAAALLQRGHRVRVFEQAAQLGEVAPLPWYTPSSPEWHGPQKHSEIHARWQTQVLCGSPTHNLAPSQER